MTPLGKPLVFYLRYMAEMNRLYGDPTYYGGEEPDLTELSDAEKVREKTRAVGAAAYEQVADFLELCGKGIEDHFTGLGIAKLEKKKSRAYVIRNWEWGTRIYVPSVPDGWFWCGVSITAPPEVHISMENNACGVVVPCLWSKGGRHGADVVWSILGGWADSRWGEGLVNEKASVALARIPIKAQPPESLDVDRDLLTAEVLEVIARIGAKETKDIAKFVAGIKGPDEG